MKKNLFILSAVAIALTSCSDEEVMKVNNGDAINFRAAVGSRATETTTDNLTSFYANAYLQNGDTYFYDAHFEKKGNVFEATGEPYYWPGTQSVSFWAYAPYGENLPAKATFTGEAREFSNFTTPAKISEQIDLVVGKGSGFKGQDVQLSFEHRLAQVEVRAKNTNDAYIYDVKGVRIANVKSKAKNIRWNSSSKKWEYTSLSDKQIYGVTYSTDITLEAESQSLMGAAGNAMLIPQTLTKWTSYDGASADEQGTYISVLVNIRTKHGVQVYPEKFQSYAWVAVPVEGTWEAGNRYVYTLDFSNGAGFPAPDQGSATGGNGGENTNIQDDGDDVSGDIDPSVPDGPTNVTPGVEEEDNPSNGSILGGPIQFTATVSGWTPVNHTPDM